MPTPWMLLAVAMHSGGLALLWTRNAQFGPALALGGWLLEAWGLGVVVDNHFVLEGLSLALLAGTASAQNEVLQSERVGALRILAGLVLFHSGLAKIWSGLWDQGEFLAFMIGRGDRFGVPFSWLIGPEEITRLSAIDPLLSDGGPYLVAGATLAVASIGVVVAELALPIALLWERTRRLAIRVSLVFILCLQSLAQEFGFAALFSMLLWSYADDREDAGSLARWTLGATVALLVSLYMMDAMGSFDRSNL